MLIYVPVKRRATLDPKKGQEIAESILQVGLQSPILVRQDGERFVLVSFSGRAASVGGVQATWAMVAAPPCCDKG